MHKVRCHKGAVDCFDVAVASRTSPLKPKAGLSGPPGFRGSDDRFREIKNPALSLQERRDKDGAPSGVHSWAVKRPWPELF